MLKMVASLMRKGCQPHSVLQGKPGACPSIKACWRDYAIHSSQAHDGLGLVHIHHRQTVLRVTLQQSMGRFSLPRFRITQDVILL